MHDKAYLTSPCPIRVISTWLAAVEHCRASARTHDDRGADDKPPNVDLACLAPAEPLLANSVASGVGADKDVWTLCPNRSTIQAAELKHDKDVGHEVKEVETAEESRFAKDVPVNCVILAEQSCSITHLQVNRTSPGCWLSGLIPLRTRLTCVALDLGLRL